MPLLPPPDHTKAVLAISIGVVVAVVIFALRSNNLPAVGDNVHSLPHGGFYKDGTKTVFYGSKVNAGSVSEHTARILSKPYAAFALICGVLFLSFFNKKKCNCTCDRCKRLA
uniref:Movement protein TGB2 n=1 Tax=Carnation latent virus TaxID=12164 RepID=A0A858Z6I7_CLV|nr:triple gene block protein 2 [Carnation latent virus]